MQHRVTKIRVIQCVRIAGAMAIQGVRCARVPVASENYLRFNKNQQPSSRIHIHKQKILVFALNFDFFFFLF